MISHYCLVSTNALTTFSETYAQLFGCQQFRDHLAWLRRKPLVKLPHDPCQRRLTHLNYSLCPKINVTMVFVRVKLTFLTLTTFVGKISNICVSE
jgi:hypothetical protein